MTSGGIQRGSEPVDQRVYFGAIDDEWRCADYGVADLPHHEAVADGPVAAEDRGPAVLVETLSTRFVADEFEGAEQALGPRFADDGVFRQ